VDEDRALQRAQQELVEFKDAYRDLQVNPLPASLEVSLKEDFRDAERRGGGLADRGFSFVDDVRFGQEWIEQLDRLRPKVRRPGHRAGVRRSRWSSRHDRTTVPAGARDVSIMRLVGATDAFIRAPSCSTAPQGFPGPPRHPAHRAAFELFRRNSTTGLHTLLFFEPKHLALGILFGVAIGLGGSLVSVGRHLRNV
jgi:hypothetical protein